jgi:hypothetical protein
MPTFGDTSFGGGSANNSNDRAWMNRATLSEEADVTSIWVYIASRTANDPIKGIVYSDNGTQPVNRLIVSSAGSTTATGWLQLSATGNLAAGNYWIGIVADGFSSAIGNDDSAPGALRKLANGTLSYTTPPATWPGTDADYADQRINVYVEYTAAGGGGSATFGGYIGGGWW